jgi:tripartite ATP-independent transporter DctM subunit
MIDLSKEVLTILMVCAIFAGIFTGFPLALVMGSISLFFGFIVFGPNVGNMLYSRIFDGVMMNYIFLAVPLFIYMGNMMEYSGMTEKLYDALYVWLGGVRGGLALLTMIIGIVIGGPVGIVAASVSMLASVGLSPMVKRGYDRALAAGTVAAGGVLGILIPPSVMFIIYGPMAQISVGKLFFAAVMPGFLLSLLYLIYIVIKCWLEPNLGPAIPEAERAKMPLSRKIWMLLTSLVPPTLLIVVVLGVMFFGIAAPTEAAGIGAFATTLLVVAFRKFSFSVLKKCSFETLKICGFVLLIVVMGFAFVGVFVGSGAGEVFANAILSAPGGKWGAFALIMLIFFALGFFIDWIAMVYILVPIAHQVAAAYGFDPLWFALMICINFQMEFMTPPMAMAIFVVLGVAPKELNITMSDCIRGIWPYVFMVIILLALCIAWPEIITWLPGKMIK